MKSLVTFILFCIVVFPGYEASMSMTTMEDTIRSLNTKLVVMENEMEKLRSGLTECKNSINVHLNKSK